jgi:predicted ATP-dependent endonuclease of OLD family
MKIEQVEIHNWRSIKSEKILFQDIMIFIGQNNHGKSNILTALLFFFGQILQDEMDFNDKNDDLFVEILFDDLDDADKSTFKKYLTSENKIRVRKSASFDGNVSYRGYLENPQLDWLTETKVRELSKREEVNKTPLKDLVPSSGRLTLDNIREAQQNYIEANRDKINFNYELETNDFLGEKRIAKGIFGDVFFIPSVKDASDELSVKGNAVFAQLYSRVIEKMSEENDQYKEAKTKILELSKILNKNLADGTENENRPKELAQLENKIEEELQTWNTKIDIEIKPPNVEDIFRLGANVWINDGIKTDIGRKGHGLQRALIFALIKAWANILFEENKIENVDIDSIRHRQSSNSRYFIIEEPELFLHPQAQRELFSTLLLLSKNKNQVILCTHSSSFIDLGLYKSISIVRRNNFTEGTKVFQYLLDLFPSDEAKKEFNLIYWINPDRGELFFAKKLILVEGVTDKTIIPYLAKKLGLYKYDYTVIDCGSKDNLHYYINLANKFQIKYVAIYDKDHQVYKNKDAKNSADIASKKIEDCIIRNLGESIIFINDIEEEIGITDKNLKHDPLYALNLISAPEFKISKNLKSNLENIYS